MSVLKQLSEDNFSPFRPKRPPYAIIDPLSLCILSAKLRKIGNLRHQYVSLPSR